MERLARDVGLTDITQLTLFENHLRLAVDRYLTDRHLEIEAPIDSKKIHTQLTQLSNDLATLQVRVNNLDQQAFSWLIHEMYYQIAPSNTPDNCAPFKNRIVELLKLTEDARLAATQITQTMYVPLRGRRPNYVLYAFLKALESIYENSSRLSAKAGFTYDSATKSYDGPFLRFTDNCVSRSAPDLKLSNNALGELIRRALGWRTQRPGK